ncbi:hypothetical protein XENOCAPTIV_014761 [Xenoophorus captivus]|uniref:UBX domain-containing protein n=1 Tax=Xenoophorus captivus TaxID=1517983 RepID=A0ABV0R219_9TELE
MDWLMEHENDPDIDEPYVPPAGNVLGGEADSLSSAEQLTAGDTGEVIAKGDDMDGDNPEGSKQPMTEEEKREQVKRSELMLNSFKRSYRFNITCLSFLESGCLFYDLVRLLDGSTINTIFKAQEPLAAVRVYVQMNSSTPEGQDFTLLSPYPRHVYTEMDMEKPLKELGGTCRNEPRRMGLRVLKKQLLTPGCSTETNTPG